MRSMSNLFAKVIGGTKNDREIRRLWPQVETINRFAEDYKILTDDELKAKTQEFKYRVRMGETLDDILPEAFAAVKETCRRLLGKKWLVRGQEIEWNMVPYDVQLLGAIALHEGKIAEMATGEGKTLVATMPLYLNALAGKGSHLVTVNDYLAQRDCEWMGRIYQFLGLTVASLHNEMDSEERRQTYNADITYGTNNEFGFDYLRDNMAVDVWSVVQRKLNYAIVDEVDSVLIDESRTPLIISGSVGAPRNVYYELKPIVANIYRRQQELVNELFRKGKALLDTDEDEAGLQLLRVLRGDPKNSQLLELLTSEFWVKKLIERLQGQYEVNKEMGMVDAELYYTIDEKSHVVDITEKGRIFLSGGRDQDIVRKTKWLDKLDERFGVLSDQKNARQYFAQDPISGACNSITLTGKVALCKAEKSLSDKLVAAAEKLVSRFAQIPAAMNEVSQNKKIDKSTAARQFFTYSTRIERLVVGLTDQAVTFLQADENDGEVTSLVNSLSGLLASLDSEEVIDRAEAERRKERVGQLFELDKQTAAPITFRDQGLTALLAHHLGGDPELVQFIFIIDSILQGGKGKSGSEDAAYLESRQDYFEFSEKGAVLKHISEKGRIAMLGGNPDLYILPDRSLVEDRDRQTQELLDRTLNQSSYDYVGQVVAIENMENDFVLLRQLWQDQPLDKSADYFLLVDKAYSEGTRIQIMPAAQEILSDSARQTRQLVEQVDQYFKSAKKSASELFKKDTQNRLLSFKEETLDLLLGLSFDDVKKKIGEWRDQQSQMSADNNLKLRSSLDHFLADVFPQAAAERTSLSRKYEEVERINRVITMVFDLYYSGDMTDAEKQRHLRRYFSFEGTVSNDSLADVIFTGFSESGFRTLLSTSEPRLAVAEKLFALAADPNVDQEALFDIEDGYPKGLKKAARTQLLDGLPFYSYKEELHKFREEVLHLSTKKVNSRAELDSILPKEKAHLRGKHILLDEREMNEILFKAHAPNTVITAEEIEHWCRIHFERKPRRMLEEQRDSIWRDYTAVEERVQNISQLLRAFTLYHKDVEYVVKTLEESDLRGRASGQKGAKAVIIVDQFTGRLMPGRRFSDGLHEALEAKEGVEVQAETQTLATITIQNFFRLYEKLAGMTGTAETESQEFFSTYKLEVVVIPTNKPVIREDYNDVIYRTKKEKYNALIDEALSMHEQGRPVLVGTISVDVSQRLSETLTQRGVPIANWLKKGDVSQELESGRFHTVLNAKFHKQEAEIVAKAGIPGTITIATNMAGRGTDIKLHQEVAKHGGLHIIGSEKHEARRIDRQLRGRSGRQGDPGSSRFYLSLEDDLMRLFGSDRITNIMSRLGPAEENERIEHPLITRSIERAQKKVEERNFEIRKNLLEYDNVLNEQRKIIYKRRQNLLGFAGAEDCVESKAKRFFNEEDERSEWKLEDLIQNLEAFFRRSADFTVTELEKLKHSEIKEVLKDWVEEQLQVEQLHRQFQFRHRLLGYCTMDALLEELVRLKIRLHNAGTRDTTKWNFAGIRYELERIFATAPDWLENEGDKKEATEVEKRLVNWARDLYLQRFNAGHEGFNWAIFFNVEQSHMLQAYVDGLMSMHLSDQVPPISWTTEDFLADLERVFGAKPHLGSNEIRTIRREKLRQMIYDWMMHEGKDIDEIVLRHRIVGYFSSLNFVDVIVYHILMSGEDGKTEQLSPQQRKWLESWFGPEAVDFEKDKEEKISLGQKISNHLRQMYLIKLEEIQQDYRDQMLVNASIEEFIAAAVSVVTKSILKSGKNTDEKLKDLGYNMQYMMLQRPNTTLPSASDEVTNASFAEDMVAWALKLHHTYSEREERLRQSALSNEIVRDSVLMMIDDTIYNIIRSAMEGGSELSPSQIRRIEAECRLVFRQSPRMSDDGAMMYDPNTIMTQLNQWAQGHYRQRIEELGAEMSSRYERYFILEKMDDNWRQHLNATDELREGIGLRGYGQKDPLLEYKGEAYNLFVKMIDRIDREVISTLFRVFDVGGEFEERQMRRAEPKNYMTTHSQVEIFKQVMGNTKKSEPSAPSAVQPPRAAKTVKSVQVGRNDPCPCGSGKKYKHCCGRNV